MVIDDVAAAAIETVLAHEGGYIDDPDDPGGATNWGVSLRYLRAIGDLTLADVDGDGDVDVDDIRQMTRAQAAAIYHREWWVRYGYGQLPVPVSAKVMDLAVNMGASQAHRIAQRALRAVDARQAVVDDGIIGPLTRRAILSVDSGRLVTAIRSEAAGFYRGLVVAQPVRQKWLRGWLNRAYY
ncbi:glycosyl hydrolase 108 family protein (plasmid) [Tistrella mobilis]|uniref:glycoside hydrolase family 108 protein n=1 Tax=Tistrella mobilis TaxID=171437 RepID=UPI003558A5B9